MVIIATFRNCTVRGLNDKTYVIEWIAISFPVLYKSLTNV